MTLQELVDRVTARGGFTAASGVTTVVVEPGRVDASLQKKPELLQYSGYFHGGVVSGLADHAAGAAVTTLLPPGRIALTVDLHVTFLAPADGEALLAKATTVRAGTTLGVATVEVCVLQDGAESVCATATAMFRVIDVPPDLREPSR
ncbi:MAG TPA: PaaI family thioesterase [Dehalococcoidia bacterium]